MPAFIIPGRAGAGTRPLFGFGLNKDCTYAEGLLGWYPLTDRRTLDMVSGVVATPNQTTIVADPLVGRMLYANNGWTAPSNRLWEFRGKQISIGGWVRLKNATDQSLFDNGIGGIVFSRLSTNVLRFTMRGVVDVTSTADNIIADTTTHVAVTYNGANVTFYVNGKSFSQVAETGSVNPSTITTGGIFVTNSAFQSLADLRIALRWWSDAEVFDMAWGHRWDLYWVPGRLVYFDIGAAAAAARAIHLKQAVNRASTY